MQHFSGPMLAWISFAGLLYHTAAQDKVCVLNCWFFYLNFCIALSQTTLQCKTGDEYFDKSKYCLLPC